MPGMKLPICIALVMCSLAASAADVGLSGYASDFTTLPSSSDWSTYSVSGSAGVVTTDAQLDSVVQTISALSIAGALAPVAVSDPSSLAVWKSPGHYLQTRPVGNTATFLMSTFRNTSSQTFLNVGVSITRANAFPVTEEVPGWRVYYSLTGSAGDWNLVPTLSTVATGSDQATLPISWNSGSSLYVLFADDNGSGSPDTANIVNSFSIVVPEPSAIYLAAALAAGALVLKHRGKRAKVSNVQ